MENNQMELNQKSGITSYNRYPRLFKFVRNSLPNINNLKILSFGCSTGEEVHTLKNIYFTNSVVDGFDINNSFILKANEKKTPNLFFTSNYNDLIPYDYDLIFVNSVLCRFPNKPVSYNFAVYEKTINQIDKLLKNNGHLVIINSNYNIEDTNLWKNYQHGPENNEIGHAMHVPRYDKNDNIVETFIKYFIFKKCVNLNIKIGIIWSPTTNVGDDFQTIAAIKTVNKICNCETVFVNRETLNSYNGDKIHVIFNGWFLHNLQNFPPSNNIIPIFISFFCKDEILIKNNVEYFKKYEPIGCRDEHTMNLFLKYNVNAYCSGCMTLCLSLGDLTVNRIQKSTNRILLNDLYGECNYIRKINEQQMETIINQHKGDIIIKNTNVVNNANLNNIQNKLNYATSLLLYEYNNKMVYTSRLHTFLTQYALNNFNQTSIKFVNEIANLQPRLQIVNKIINNPDIGKIYKFIIIDKLSKALLTIAENKQDG